MVRRSALSAATATRAEQQQQLAAGEAQEYRTFQLLEERWHGASSSGGDQLVSR